MEHACNCESCDCSEATLTETCGFCQADAHEEPEDRVDDEGVDEAA